MSITTEEWHKMQAKGKRRNKYSVAKPADRTWAGKVFASKAEMLYAQRLYEAQGRGEILEIIEQPRLWLGVRENVYVPDFLVIARDGGGYYVDVKGTETPAFRKVKKLWAVYGRIPLKIVKLKRSTFHVIEIITPEKA